MTIKEAKKIKVGSKIIVENDRRIHTVESFETNLCTEKKIYVWTDRGGLYNHKKIEKIVEI